MSSPGSSCCSSTADSGDARQGIRQAVTPRAWEEPCKHSSVRTKWDKRMRRPRTTHTSHTPHRPFPPHHTATTALPSQPTLPHKVHPSHPHHFIPPAAPRHAPCPRRSGRCASPPNQQCWGRACERRGPHCGLQTTWRRRTGRWTAPWAQCHNQLQRRQQRRVAHCEVGGVRPAAAVGAWCCRPPGHPTPRAARTSFPV